MTCSVAPSATVDELGSSGAGRATICSSIRVVARCTREPGARGPCRRECSAGSPDGCRGRDAVLERNGVLFRRMSDNPSTTQFVCFKRPSRWHGDFWHRDTSRFHIPVSDIPADGAGRRGSAGACAEAHKVRLPAKAKRDVVVRLSRRIGGKGQAFPRGEVDQKARRISFASISSACGHVHLRNSGWP